MVAHDDPRPGCHVALERVGSEDDVGPLLHRWAVVLRHSFPDVDGCPSSGACFTLPASIGVLLFTGMGILLGN